MFCVVGGGAGCVASSVSLRIAPRTCRDAIVNSGRTSWTHSLVAPSVARLGCFQEALAPGRVVQRASRRSGGKLHISSRYSGGSCILNVGMDLEMKPSFRSQGKDCF